MNQKGFDLKVPIKKLTYLKEVDSISLQCTFRNLDIAFKNFFQKEVKYPKFKYSSNHWVAIFQESLFKTLYIGLVREHVTIHILN